MQWRKRFKSFSFTKNERDGAISLLVLIALFGLFQKVVHHFAEPPWKPTREDVFSYVEQHEAIVEDAEEPKSEQRSDHKPGWEEEHFNFDPNTISNNDWRRLGLSDTQISSLRKFMSFGYPFKSKEDLKKVYVLDSKWLERHWEEIVITQKEEPFVQQNKPGAEPKIEVANAAKININQADTLELAGIKGIGSYSARRIWKFKQALGGFYSVDQLSEVYGLHPETLPKLIEAIYIDSSQVERLNVNLADQKTLAQHPYCSWKLAGSITKYRTQHGPFSNLSELLQIHLITDSIFVKLKPYLTIEE